MPAFARTRLGITEAQEPQWQALAEVVRAEAARLRPAIEELRALRGAEDATAPEALERLERAASAGAEALGAVRAAFDDVYAALDDAQKERVDEILRRGPHGRGGPDGPRGGRG